MRRRAGQSKVSHASSRLSQYNKLIFFVITLLTDTTVNDNDEDTMMFIPLNELIFHV